MPIGSAIACLVWIGGLLLALLLDDAPQFLQWLIFVVVLCISSGLAAFFVPKYWRRGPKPVFYLLMGLLALWAAIYYQLRSPQPSSQDISRFLSKSHYSREVTVTGELVSEGRTNSRGMVQFDFKAELAKMNFDSPFQSVTGQVYLTLPKTLGEKFSACQKLRVTGQLYRPRRNQNPGSFDFQSYLANQGIFAGLKGETAVSTGQGFCLITQWRSRIIQSQSQWLPKSEQGNSLEGLLISSIVLGQKAVNLPQQLRDLFSRVGLSHVLAASGYQVSLLVGTTLSVSQKVSRKGRFALGMGVLLIYLGLTGLQPSVTRAGLIWVAILLGDLLDRRVRPLGALLVAATLMLIINPHWIGDLGFQLSFLATFGILVSVPYFEQKFDFLPPKIAEIIAVPLAASLWTLPLLLSQFSQFVAVAIPLNILATPLVEIISLGGIISAIAALIYADLGSVIAWILYYPTNCLIKLATIFDQFPPLAVGKLSIVLLILIYGSMVTIWLNSRWQKYAWVIAIILLSLLIIPLVYQQLTLVRITIFDQSSQPILVIQEGSKTTLIEDGKAETKQFLLNPFLAQSGINQISCQWNPLGSQSANCSTLHWLSHNPPILELVFKRQYWWFFLTKDTANLPTLATTQTPPNIVVWTGKFPDYDWLEKIHPQTAIAITSFISKKISRRLKTKAIELYVTGQDGAIQWTPQGFQSAIAFPESQ